jgi:hypothetical protein
MKSCIRVILCALLFLLTVNVFGQTDKLALQISNDPDWHIISNNNADFLKRMLQQPNTLSEIWSRGQDNFLLQLGYSREEYYERRMETREAAARLLNRYPLLNAPGSCNSCTQSELQLTGKIDAVVSSMRVARQIDATDLMREIESDEDGPKCGWRFYACVIVCAGTIEIFPVYLACCALCMCEYCKNPPAWCE